MSKGSDIYCRAVFQAEGYPQHHCGASKGHTGQHICGACGIFSRPERSTMPITLREKISNSVTISIGSHIDHDDHKALVDVIMRVIEKHADEQLLTERLARNLAFTTTGMSWDQIEEQDRLRATAQATDLLADPELTIAFRSEPNL